MNWTLRDGLLALVTVVAVLCCLPWALDTGTVAWLCDEDGPLEGASVWGWFAGGLWLLHRGVRIRRWLPWAFAMVMLVMGIREAGLPPELIPSGKALMSWRYYANADIDLARRIIPGVVIVLTAISLVAAVGATLRHLLRGGWRRTDGQWLVLAFIVLVAGQLSEAAAEQLNGEWRNMAWLLEEGLECLGAWLVAGWTVLRPNWVTGQDKAPEA